MTVFKKNLIYSIKYLILHNPILRTFKINKRLIDLCFDQKMQKTTASFLNRLLYNIWVILVFGWCQNELEFAVRVITHPQSRSFWDWDYSVEYQEENSQRESATNIHLNFKYVKAYSFEPFQYRILESF